MDGDGDDDEFMPASSKKANRDGEVEKKQTKAKVVKAEPGVLEDGVSDHEVSFF